MKTTTLLLCFSANFAFKDKRMDEKAGVPLGSRYSMSLHEVKFPSGTKPRSVQKNRDL